MSKNSAELLREYSDILAGLMEVDPKTLASYREKAGKELTDLKSQRSGIAGPSKKRSAYSDKDIETLRHLNPKIAGRQAGIERSGTHAKTMGRIAGEKKEKAAAAKRVENARKIKDFCEMNRISFREIMEIAKQLEYSRTNRGSYHDLTRQFPEDEI